MYEKIKNLTLKTFVSAFNNGLIYNYDKENDEHMIACLDVDTVSLSKFKLTSNDSVEQIDSCQIKIDPIEPSNQLCQFCLFELHRFKFLDFDLFCLISSNGLHVNIL